MNKLLANKNFYRTRNPNKIASNLFENLKSKIDVKIRFVTLAEKALMQETPEIFTTLVTLFQNTEAMQHKIMTIVGRIVGRMSEADSAARIDGVTTGRS